MTTRDDITVLYHLDPRLILVAKPSNEVTMQDLHDTLMDIDDEPANMVYPHLVESAGKEDLGGGVSVGITLTLQNAQIAFERREEVKAVGVITTDSAPGSITQLLTDSSATFITDGIERGDLVSNSTDISACEVVDVLSETQLQVLSPGAGLTSDFTIGDNYQIWETETCNFSGGNLVAVDPDGNTIEALFPTYCVTAKVTASSAATLQNTAQLEYGTFDGGVHVDLSSPYSGIAYPTGTPQQRVNNFSDALTIMQTRGFTKMFVHGSATIDSGLDYSGLEIIGESPNKTIFTITSSADVADSEFSNATIQGTLDGGNVLTDCSLLTINYIDGIIQRCLLLETVTLSGAATAFFLDCWSGVQGAETPEINMGGSGSELAVRNYSGGLELTNKSGNDPVSIDMSSGQIIVNDTVTNGTIVLRGVAKWTNEKAYSGGADIRSELITFQDTQQLAFEGGSIHINVSNGFTGTAYPRGTVRMPVNNIEDALVIASGQTIESFDITGFLTLPSGTDISYKAFYAENGYLGQVNIAEGAITKDASFTDIAVFGTLNGRCDGTRATLYNTQNIDGQWADCAFIGTISLDPASSNGLASFTNLYASTIQEPYGKIDFNGSGVGIALVNLYGPAEFINKTGEDAGRITGVDTNIIINDSVDAGTLTLEGTGGWDNEDTYAGGATINNGLVSMDAIQTNIANLAGNVIHTGTSVGGGTDNSIVMASGAASFNGAYDPAMITITGGTGAGQTRLIYQYNGASRTGYVDRNWKINPDNTSTYSVFSHPGREHINEGLLQSATANTATLNANASDVDHVYAHQLIFLRGGTGEDQVGLIEEYNGTTKVATMFEDWAVQPSGDTSYVILPTHMHHTVDANVIQVSGVPVSLGDFGGGTPTQVADAVWNSVIESGYTAEETMKIMLSSLAGKLSGAGGTTIRIRDVNDTKDRITATVDEDGNRATIVLDTS